MECVNPCQAAIEVRTMIAFLFDKNATGTIRFDPTVHTKPLLFLESEALSLAVRMEEASASGVDPAPCFAWDMRAFRVGGRRLIP